MMNNELSAESNLNNLITVNFTETMIPEIELTETELEAMDDIRIQDELTATVAELPVATEEQIAPWTSEQALPQRCAIILPSL